MSINRKIRHRRSIRLKGHDYSQAGAYFVTICCEGMKMRFGRVENREMILNDFGTIAYNEWIKLADRYSHFELNIFQIMPNHMHGIIVLKVDAQIDNIGAGASPAPTTAPAPTGQVYRDDARDGGDDRDGRDDRDGGATARVARTDRASIGEIIAAYKSIVAVECLKNSKAKNERLGKLWQRNYYEHIIRNEVASQRISSYIIDNPKNWKEDKFYRK